MVRLTTQGARVDTAPRPHLKPAAEWLASRAAKLRASADRIEAEARESAAEIVAKANERAARILAAAKAAADEKRKEASQHERDAEKFAAGRQGRDLRDQIDRHDRSDKSETGHDADIVGGIRMQDAHALAISKARTRRRSDDRLAADDRLARAAHEKKLTLRGLSRAVSEKLGRKISPSQLPMARSGERPIPRDVAEAIEKITGYKAIPGNWPGGISDRPSRKS